MISLGYILLAEKIFYKKEGGKATFKNVFDSLIVDRLPTKIDDFYLVIGVVGEEEDHEQEFKVRFSGHKDMDFRKDLVLKYYFHEQVTLIPVKIGNFPIVDYGTMYIEISYKDQSIGKCPLVIEKGG